MVTSLYDSAALQPIFPATVSGHSLVHVGVPVCTLSCADMVPAMAACASRAHAALSCIVLQPKVQTVILDISMHLIASPQPATGAGLMGTLYS